MLWREDRVKLYTCHGTSPNRKEGVRSGEGLVTSQRAVTPPGLFGAHQALYDRAALPSSWEIFVATLVATDEWTLCVQRANPTQRTR